MNIEYAIIKKLEELSVKNRSIIKFLSTIAGRQHNEETHELSEEDSKNPLLEESIKTGIIYLDENSIFFQNDFDYKFFLSYQLIDQYLTYNDISDSKKINEFIQTSHKWKSKLKPYRNLPFLTLRQIFKVDTFKWIEDRILTTG